MKKLFTALVVAMVLLVGIAPTASAQIDLLDVKAQFRNVLNTRVYGFDFYNLVPGSGWTGEIRGKYGHVLADTAVGWGITGAGLVTDATLVTGSKNISTFVSGTMYVINATAAVILVLNEAPSAGEYHLFAIGTATSAVEIDVAAGVGTDYSLWGANKTFAATVSAGKVFALYQGKTAAGALRWAISDPKNEYVHGTLDVNGDTTVSAALSIDQDSRAFSLGASGDLTLVHNGTNSIIDSVLAGADLILKLGDDLATSIFTVENNTGTDLLTVDATGAANFAGNVDATGGLDVDSDTDSVSVGIGGDCALSHDGTNSSLTNYTGVLYVQQASPVVDVAGRGTVVSAGTGGAAAIAGGGVGGTLTASGGVGGAALDALNAGAGGPWLGVSGVGGEGSAAGAGLAGAGGTSTVRGGAGGVGGAAVASGAGGAVALEGGAAGGVGGAGTGAVGGNVSISAGAGTGAANGGDVTVDGGNSAGGTVGRVIVGASNTSDVRFDADIPVYFGATEDLSIQHDGTNSIVDSALAGADLILKLGDDLVTSIFTVENNTGTDLLNITADGTFAGVMNANSATAFVLSDGTSNQFVVETDATPFLYLGNATDNPPLSVLGTGQITLTGNVDALAGLDVTGDYTQSGFRLAQVLHFNSLVGVVPGWPIAPGGLQMPAGIAGGANAWVPLSGLKLGDVIQGYTIVGGGVGAANPNETTVTSRLYSAVSVAGGVTLTALGAGDTTGVQTGNFVLTVLSEAALATTVAADTEYYLEINGVTGAGGSVYLVGATATVDLK